MIRSMNFLRIVLPMFKNDVNFLKKCHFFPCDTRFYHYKLLHFTAQHSTKAHMFKHYAFLICFKLNLLKDFVRVSNYVIWNLMKIFLYFELFRISISRFCSIMWISKRFEFKTFQTCLYPCVRSIFLRLRVFVCDSKASFVNQQKSHYLNRMCKKMYKS